MFAYHYTRFIVQSYTFLAHLQAILDKSAFFRKNLFGKFGLFRFFFVTLHSILRETPPKHQKTTLKIIDKYV